MSKPNALKRYKKQLIENLGSVKCIYCSTVLDRDNLTIEHIKPKFLGGTNKKENLAPCCKNCNHEKGSADGHKLSKMSVFDIIKVIVKRSKLNFEEICELTRQVMYKEAKKIKRLTKVRLLYEVDHNGVKYRVVYNSKNAIIEDVEKCNG